MEINPSFWRGKRVFITGHSGFKGSWLVLLLNRLGAEIHGFSLGKPSEPCLFDVARVDRACVSTWGDVRDAEALRAAVLAARPDVAFHLAAQPLVRRSYLDPVETFSTNVMGTVRFLDALKDASHLKAAVVITTDKVYENHESARGYTEDEPLGGHDPYSASKACAELVTGAVRRATFAPRGVGLASVRAGNVIGGGDWGEDRIVPDFVRALTAGVPLRVRRPEAVRPWQHVLDPLRGYLMVAERMADDAPTHSRAWNFGPDETDHRTVREVVDALRDKLGEGRWEKEGGQHPHETTLLKLDSTLAREKLGWWPLFGFDRSIASIAEWTRAWRAGEKMDAVTDGQISEALKGVL